MLNNGPSLSQEELDEIDFRLCHTDDIDEVREILLNYAHVVSGFAIHSCLEWAQRARNGAGNLDMIRLLFSHINPNRDSDMVNHLFYNFSRVCDRGNLDVLKLFLEYCKDILTTTDILRTISSTIHCRNSFRGAGNIAAVHNNVEVVRMLLPLLERAEYERVRSNAKLHFIHDLERDPVMMQKYARRFRASLSAVDKWDLIDELDFEELKEFGVIGRMLSVIFQGAPSKAAANSGEPILNQYDGSREESNGKRRSAPQAKLPVKRAAL